MKKYQISGFEILEFDEVDSTNTVAEKMALSDLKDKRVILTWRQTQGRGQATNRWESEPGKNIAMTVIFRPDGLEAGKQFAISMVIALGCLDFVSRYVRGGTVKWPNDIYVGDRKIAGSLIEHRVAGACIQSSLCGIGLNVNQSFFLSDAPNPVSLKQLTGKELDLQQVLAELLECIGRRYARIKDYVALETDFRKNMYRACGIYGWSDVNGAFQASVAGIDEYGQLILEDTEGRRRLYAFKEVKYG
ncbi:MAG: biotin--[acetyl-CoA-carboxylase] ligase [Odoribacter sp.]|nr:biotin--[acetyl-CoA-carboxylase] ligase [Odoribacter sp.]